MLNWNPYDAHDWANSDQEPMDPAEKTGFEQLAVAILKISAAEASTIWGTVQPPGRNAYVIRIHDGVRHQFARNKNPLGLKVFNLVDGKTMWPSVSRFHNTQRKNLPGLPNERVQAVWHCATIKPADSVERGYLIQAWVEGEVLEHKFKGELSEHETLRLLDDLFLELIIPLWSAGSSWWDVRASNYVVTPAGRLMMIDSDTLGGYADEIVGTPAEFVRRNKGTLTALKRYRTIVRKLAVACLKRQGVRQTGWIGTQVDDRFIAQLQPVFARPYPLVPGWRQQATRAYHHFRAACQQLLSAPAAAPAATGSSGSAKNSK